MATNAFRVEFGAWCIWLVLIHIPRCNEYWKSLNSTGFCFFAWNVSVCFPLKGSFSVQNVQEWRQQNSGQAVIWMLSETTLGPLPEEVRQFCKGTHSLLVTYRDCWQLAALGYSQITLVYSHKDKRQKQTSGRRVPVMELGRPLHKWVPQLRTSFWPVQCGVGSFHKTAWRAQCLLSSLCIPKQQNRCCCQRSMNSTEEVVRPSLAPFRNTSFLAVWRHRPYNPQ